MGVQGGKCGIAVGERQEGSIATDGSWRMCYVLDREVVAEKVGIVVW